MRAALTVAVLAAALACGPHTPSSPPPDSGGNSGGGGSGGGGSGGGGSGGGGGDTSGGGSGGGGSSGGGAAGGGGSGGSAGDGSGGNGSGAGNAAPGPIAAPDGSLTIDVVDAAGECASLMPASAPSAVSIHSAFPGPCGAGISEGGGHVAVGTWSGQGIAEWQVFDAAGVPTGFGFANAWNGLDRPAVFPQQDGFQTPHYGPLSRDELYVWTVSGDGVRLLRNERATPAASDRPTTSWLHVEDPQGGSALVSAGFASAGTHPCIRDVSRFDATGAPRGAPTEFGHPVSACAPAYAAVSRMGDALVVEIDSGTAWLWWIPPGLYGLGSVNAGSAFALFSRFAPVRLAPLLDGSIVASEGGVWTRRFEYHADHAGDAPGWLASRPGFRFRNTRGNRGYALLPPEGVSSGDCSQRVEIVSPSGQLCGTVTLNGDGGTCSTAAVDQGWDGTVVQQGARDRCSWRSWPRLLAGD